MSFCLLLILTVLTKFSPSVSLPSDNNITRTLQLFGGTLTKLTCSAIQPAFRLTVKWDSITVVYGPEQYSDLPDLLNIDVTVSPTRNNVTLFINGTNRSNNVTVQCRNITDPVFGRFEVLFTLMLEFISTLSAPNDVHYDEDPDGYQQIRWGPPTLVSDEPGSQNVSVDSRITHYIIYIITNESTAVYNVSGTSFVIENGISCSFWFQVAAVNPAGVGERSSPLTFDLHTGCMGSTSSTTDMMMDLEPILASSGLSAGEIAAVIVGVVLIITGLLVILAIAFAMLKKDRHQRVIQSLKSEIRSDKLSNPTEDSVAEIKKCVESDHCGSGNDPDVTDKKQQSDSTPTRSYSQDGPPVYYAEINVLTKKQNKVPEPDSEGTSHHVYAILEQPSPQIADTDQEKINDDDDNPDLQY